MTTRNNGKSPRGPGGGNPAIAQPALDKRAILDSYPFFRDAGPRLQAEIERVAMTVHAEPQGCFFGRGTSCPQVALVGGGDVRVFIASESGREITLYHVGPGETCPVNLLSVLLGRAAPATAVIDSALTAVVLPADLFRRWVAEEPVVRQYVFEAIAVRLVDILALLEEITFGKLDQRLADFLLRRAGDSGRQAGAIELTHEQIAVELSTAREVVSRLLREFERQGAVELARGRIQVRDPGPLQTLRT